MGHSQQSTLTVNIANLKWPIMGHILPKYADLHYILYLYFEHYIGTATIIDDIMSVLSNQHLFKCGFHCSHFYSTLSETERSLMVPTYFATRQSQASKIYVYKNCIIIKAFIFPNLCFSPPASNLEPWNFKMN